MKTFVKILSSIVAFILLVLLFNIIFFEPWIEKKILAALDKEDSGNEIKIGEVNILFLSPGIELESVIINPKTNQNGLKGEVESVKFKGVNLAKLIFENDIDVSEVIISNSSMEGRVSFSRVKHIVSSLNINIEKVIFDKIDLAIQSDSTRESYSVKEGFIDLYNFKIARRDTLFLKDAGEFDLRAAEVLVVSRDSFYTFKANGINYSAASNRLSADSFLVIPGYKDYDFTSRHEFQTDCIEAEFRNITAHDFSAADYLKSNSLISSLVEIEGLNLNVFRDRRKKFRHVNKPMLQEVLYKYDGKINIDSINIKNGKIRYTEHAENSKEPGSIFFREVNAQFNRVTNDTIYKSKEAYTEFKSEALLMGKAKVTFHLKAKLFDSRNTFWLSGNLSSIEAKALNSMLERNVYIHAESGKVDTMTFNFSANNTTATGEMLLLYSGLSFKAEGEYANAPASVLQVFISSITGIKAKESNPAPGEKARLGIIDYDRDPEKFIFNYCFKSILSGIKSSISKNPKATKKEKA